MSQTFYRTEAVAHLSSPEQLDTAVQITRPRSWIALTAVGLLLAGFIVWCFVGSIQSTFPGAGVLLTPYGTFDSVAPGSGIVRSVAVAQGDQVSRGDPLLTLETEAGDTVIATAPSDGLVVELVAFPNDHIETGEKIAIIQPADDDLRVFMYVPVSGQQPINPGMEVQISVTTIPSEEYGLLRGTVTRVGTHPVTRDGVDALLNNEALTAIVVSGGAPVIQVEVALTEASTPTGYAWTSGDGPPEALSAGTLVNASVITAVRHPIALLFPSNRAGG